jgi:hypothetical protein
VRDLTVFLLHLPTVARLAGPGYARSVVAESVLVKHQLLILNRARKRSPNLRLSDRMVAVLCALLVRPRRLILSMANRLFPQHCGMRHAQRRSDIGRHATSPQSWIQRENWKLETHRPWEEYAFRADPGSVCVAPDVLKLRSGR